MRTNSPVSAALFACFRLFSSFRNGIKYGTSLQNKNPSYLSPTTMSDDLSTAEVSAKMAYQLTEDERLDLLVAIARAMVGDKLPHGLGKEIAKAFLYQKQP